MGVFRRTKRPSRRKISSQPRYDHFDTSPCIFNVNRAFRKMQEKHARTILNCEIWTPEKPYITVISGGWIDQSGFPFRVVLVMTTSIPLRVCQTRSEHLEPQKRGKTKMLERRVRTTKYLVFRTHENPWKQRETGGWKSLSCGGFRVLHLRPLGQLSVYVIPYFFQKLLERTDGKNNKIFNFRTGENPVFIGFLSGGNSQLFKKFRIVLVTTTSIRLRIY